LSAASNEHETAVTVKLTFIDHASHCCVSTCTTDCVFQFSMLTLFTASQNVTTRCVEVEDIKSPIHGQYNIIPKINMIGNTTVE